MTVIFRGRVDPKKLKKAEKVAADLGTSVPELFRIFVAEVARTGSVPVSLATGHDDAPLFSNERRNRIWRGLDGLTPMTKAEAKEAFAPDPEWDALELAMTKRAIHRLEEH